MIFNDNYVPEPNSGCWLWIRRYTRGMGYGSFQINRQKNVRAHRHSWEIHKGPIPAKTHVLHRCDVPSCVNPDHLFLGTAKDNMLDKAAKGRHHNQKITHCPRGHEYTEKNTYRYRNERFCKTCKQARKKFEAMLK